MAEAHDAFAHLRTELAPTYRALLAAFVAARRRYAMHLRPGDLGDHLRRVGAAEPDPAALTAALAQLCAWGNLRAHPDTGRVTTVEDFHRARYLYQLTSAGEAAEQALAVFDEALGRRGSLQAVALADIAAYLRALQELARAPAPDPGKVFGALDALAGRFRALADNAEAFMGSLQRSIDLHGVDVDAFVAYKGRLVGYLERFIADLQTTGAEIAALVVALDGPPVRALLDLAVEREATDVAPGEVADAEAEGARQLALLRAGWQERWDGVRSWFVSEPGHPSQAVLLRGQARSAVPALLQVVAALNERRQGRSDRSADFRALAVRFAAAPDDATRHRLWHATSGLSPVRHLSVDADTLEQREQAPVPPSAAWVDAPPVLVSPQLRRTGTWERRGRPSAVRDRSRERQHLAARAAEESEQTAAARAQLLSDGPRRLSELPVLEPAAFGLFLSVLGTALARSRPGGAAVVTTTGDGALVVELQPVAGAPEVLVRTPEGDLTGPDHLFWVRDPAGVDAEAAS